MVNLEVNRTYGRQLGLFDPFVPENQKRIAVIGAGTIGSWAVLGLAKMGMKNISVFDDDRIESQNIPNQLYMPSQVGMQKIQALGSLVATMTGETMTVFQTKYPCSWEGPEAEFEIVVCAVDNMQARAVIWDYLKQKSWLKYYIDARSGGNGAKLYGVDMSNAEQRESYESTLHPDTQSYANSEVQSLSNLPCTERSVVDTNMGIAAKIVTAVRLWITKNTSIEGVIIDAFDGEWMDEPVFDEEGELTEEDTEDPTGMFELPSGLTT